LISSDLSLSQKAVQSSHAVIEAAKAGLYDEGEHPHLVLCSVSPEHLERWVHKLDNKGIQYREFREPDLDDKLTAIATQKVEPDDRKIFSNLRLI